LQTLTGKKIGAKRKEQILCFSYGSNMLSSRMKHADRVPSAKLLGIGYITGYRLTFDKMSKKDGSGKCDAEVTKDEKDRVYGVVYTVETSQKHKLDSAEGLGNGYEEKTTDVITTRGQRRAVMYCATSKDPSLKPYHWYKAYVVAGAVEHQLPFPYIEWLRTVESIQDPDPARRAKEERLLTTCQLIRSTRTRAKTARVD